jgi:predicted PurR-regulated permease PerM
MSVPASTWVRPLLLALLLVGMAALCGVILEPFIAPIVWAAILAYASWPLFLGCAACCTATARSRRC